MPRIYGTWSRPAPLGGRWRILTPRVTTPTGDPIVPEGLYDSGELTVDADAGTTSLDYTFPDLPDSLPAGWRLKLIVDLEGGDHETYSLDVASTTNPVDLNEVLLPGTTDDTPQSLVRGVPGGVAPLDLDGDVTDAEGTKVLPTVAATTEDAGLVELADDQETIDGVDDQRATTPRGVKAAILAALTAWKAVKTVNNLAPDANGNVTVSTSGGGTLPQNLTDIANLNSAASGVIASDGAGWVRKTYEALKTSLGLGNVDNTRDVDKKIPALYGPSGLPALEAVAGGGARLNRYIWPTWGFGGSTKVKNPASPSVFNLPDLDVDGLMFLHGPGYATLDQAITTPFVTAYAGNVGGVAQKLKVWFELVPNEYDPVTGQSVAYIWQLDNAHWFGLHEKGYPVLKFRDSAGTLYTATNLLNPLDENNPDAAAQWVPKTHLRGYYLLDPSNPAQDDMWTFDLFVVDSEGNEIQWGQQYVGNRAITAYKEVLTNNAGIPWAQQVARVGQGATGQQYRGGLIRVAVYVGDSTTPVVQLNADEWAQVEGATFTDHGVTWTMANPQPHTFVTETCLASAGLPWEYVTITGSSDDPLVTPVQLATTPGVYTSLETTGFEWSAELKTAVSTYRDSNALINTIEDPAKKSVDVVVDENGNIVWEAPGARLYDQDLATQAFTSSAAAGARSAAIAKSSENFQAALDGFLHTMTGAITFDPNDLAVPVGEKRVWKGIEWQLQVENPGGLPPMGFGDGSPADQRIVVEQQSPIFLAAGGTGGLGAEPTYLTTLADDAISPPVGSLRRIINDHNAAWAAWAIEKWEDPDFADEPPKLWVVADFDALEADLDEDGIGWIQADWDHADKNVRDFRILAENWTYDFQAIPGGIVINGGGLPGPVPYQTNSGAVAAGTYTSGSPLAVPTTSAADWGKTKMRKGVTVDIAKYADPVARTGWTIYAKSMVVEDFVLSTTDKNGPGTLYLSGTVDTPAPSGALVIYALNPVSFDPDTGVRRHLEPGKVGSQFVIGGEAYSDLFGPGKPNRPVDNGILQNLAIRSDWGGDVLDSGDANDFTINFWSRRLSMRNCDWRNPSPFHDTMVQVAKGSRKIGFEMCVMADHYKSVNLFGGNTGSGGVSPDGTTPTPNVHVFPPGIDETNAEANDYPFEPGVVGDHGNPFGKPVVINEVLFNLCLFTGNGQRSPKNIRGGEMDLVNFIVMDYGLPPGDPILEVATRFPLDPLEGPTAPAPLITGDRAKSLYRNGRIIPHYGATGGGLRGIKNSSADNSAPGYTKAVDVIHELAPGTGLQAVSEPDRRPDLVPNFDDRYVVDILPKDVYTRYLLYGAGAGKQSRLWKPVGVAALSATFVGQVNGVDVGPLGSEAAVGVLNLSSAFTTSYDAETRTWTVDITLPADAFVAKGPIDCSANPNYPAANAGDVYRVSVAGKIGGASGPNVEVGDMLTCWVDSSAAGTHAAVGANWSIQQTNVDGAVVGPASSTSGDFATFSGTTGKVVQDSGLSLDTDGTMAANSDTRLPSQKAVKTYAQLKSAILDAFAALTPAAGKLPYFSGASAVSLLDISSWFRGTNALNASSSADLKSKLGIADAAPLARVSYHPSAAQTAASVATSTLTDIGTSALAAAWSGVAAATHFDLTFVVPASQIVCVEFEGLVKGSASGTNVRMGLADRAGTLSFTGTSLATSVVAVGTGTYRARYRKYVDFSVLGVAAGTTVTLVPQWAASTGSATLDVGGTNGPAIALATAG